MPRNPALEAKADEAAAKTNFGPEQIITLLRRLADEYEEKLDKMQSACECVEEELGHINEAIIELSQV